MHKNNLSGFSFNENFRDLMRPLPPMASTPFAPRNFDQQVTFPANCDKINHMSFKILPFDPTNASFTYEFLLDTFGISFGSDKALWPN